jgi:hypothetical protein
MCSSIDELEFVMKQGDQVLFASANGVVTDMVWEVFADNGWNLVRMVTGTVVPADSVLEVVEA